MFSNILHKIRTKEEVYRVIEEIDLLLTSLYENGDKGFESTLKTGVRSWVAEFVTNEIEKNKNRAEEFLKSLKDELVGLESVNLTLAFEPSDQTLSKFTSELREATGKSVLLDVDIDKKILGGVVIDYKGRYKDLSVARLMSESEAEIEDIIREKMRIAS